VCISADAISSIFHLSCLNTTNKIEQVLNNEIQGFPRTLSVKCNDFQGQFRLQGLSRISEHPEFKYLC